MSDKKQIFISHATVNDDLVDKIATKLDPHISLWIDHQHGLTPETPDWESALRVAIADCDAGVLVMTHASLTSKICKAECLLVQNLKKPLYVIRAEAVDFKDIWLNISLIQYADYVKDADKSLSDLMSAVSGKVGADLPTPSTKKFTDAGNIHEKLPYLHNPMRGREALLAEVMADIIPSHITQVIGPGGLGKSRLAAEIALNDPNGAVWFRCEVTKSIADLNNAMRRHADLPDGTDVNIAIAHIKSQNALMVVDNAETIAITQRPFFVEMLHTLRGAGIRVLMTSREAWQDLKNSTFHPIGGIDGPEGEQIIRDFATAESLNLTDAQLKELAHASLFYPRLMEFNIIQLREFEYDVVLKRLKKLRYEAHEDWQGALNEMITITVDQMKAERNEKSKTPEKRGVHADALLRRLTWLSAPCEKAVILALKPADMTEDDVDDALALIRRYQFIRYDDQTKKYALAELVREALGTDPTAFPIFADWYIGRAKTIFYVLADYPELWADGVGGANEDDVENIKGLGDDLRYLTQEGTAGDLARALEFAVVTRRYVTRRMEGGAWAWLEMGLNAVRLLRRDKPDDDDLLDSEALMLGELGLIKDNLGYSHDALRYYKQSLVLLYEQGDKRGKAIVLTNIGKIYHELGSIQEALEYYQDALLLHRQVDNKRMEATTLNNIGVLYYTLGNLQKALNYYEQALPLHRQVDNKQMEATTLNNLGMVYHGLRNIQKALVYFEQALSILRNVGDKRGEGSVLNNIAGIYYTQGNKRKALLCFEQALSISRAVGDRRGEASALNNIAEAYYAQGNKRKALLCFEQALSISRAVGDRRGEATTCFNMGMVYEALGDLEKAIEYVEHALLFGEQVQSPNAESDRRVLLRLKQKRGG